VVDPTAPQKLDALIRGVKGIGRLVTFKEACEETPVKDPFYVEDGYAWHRTYAEVWGGTPEAQHWDPMIAEIRKDYKTTVQPIAEGTLRKKLRPLVEKFWFHTTNAANSDGRWPAPPAKTCPFNREWVAKEMDAARKALAELKRSVKGIKLPKPREERPDPNAESSYALHFTDKKFSEPRDIPRLNTYELSHAIYYFHSMVDSGVTAKVAKGKKMLRAIFAELDRRKMKGIRPVAAR
jgi:hypothetical protein